MEEASLLFQPLYTGSQYVGGDLLITFKALLGLSPCEGSSGRGLLSPSEAPAES